MMPMSYIKVLNEKGEIIDDLQYQEHLSKCNSLIDHYQKEFEKFRKKPDEKRATSLLVILQHLQTSCDLAKNAYHDQPEVQAGISKACNEGILLQENNLIYGYYRSNKKSKSKPKSLDELVRKAFRGKSHATLLQLFKKIKKSDFDESQLKDLSQISGDLQRINDERRKLKNIRITKSSLLTKEDKKEQLDLYNHQELITRNKMIATLKSQLADPKIHRKYERQIWKVINYQHQKIENIIQRSPEMQAIISVQRDKDDMIGEITKALEGFKPKDNVSRNDWINMYANRDTWQNMLKEQLPNMEVSYKGGGNNPLFVVKDPTTQRSVVVRRLLLQGHYIENTERVGKSYFQALKRARENNIDHHFSEQYSYVEFGQSIEGENVMLEVSEVMTSDLEKKVKRDAERLDDEEHMQNVAKHSMKLLKLLNDLDTANIYYPDIKPSNIMVDEDGELRISDIKSLFVRDGSGQIPMHFTEITRSYTNTQSEDSHRNLLLDNHESISMGVVLYELATGEVPERIAGERSAHNFNFDQSMFKTPTGEKLKEYIIKLTDPLKQIDKNIDQAHRALMYNKTEIALSERILQLAKENNLDNIEFDADENVSGKGLATMFDLHIEDGKASEADRQKHPGYLLDYIEKVVSNEEEANELQLQIEQMKLQIKDADETTSLVLKPQLAQLEQRYNQCRDYNREALKSNLFGDMKLLIKKAKQIQSQKSNLSDQEEKFNNNIRKIEEQMKETQESILSEQQKLKQKTEELSQDENNPMLEGEIKLIELEIHRQQQTIEALNLTKDKLIHEKQSLKDGPLSHLLEPFERHRQAAQSKVTSLSKYIDTMSDFKQKHQNYYTSDTVLTTRDVKEEIAQQMMKQSKAMSEPQTLNQQQRELLEELNRARKPVAPTVETYQIKRQHTVSPQQNHKSQKVMEAAKVEREKHAELHRNVMKEMQQTKPFQDIEQESKSKKK